jgi:hypothetical protein
MKTEEFGFGFGLGRARIDRSKLTIKKNEILVSIFTALGKFNPTKNQQI